MAIKFHSRVMRKAMLLGLRLHRNIKGVAALEFALIVPLLFMMLLGTFEFGTALTVDRRVSKVAGSIADLVSRTDKVSDAQLQFMGNQIAKSMMVPYDFSKMQVNIVQVKADINNASNTTVNWSSSFKNGSPIASPYAKGAAFTMPVGLMGAGTYMVIAQVTYDYTPLIFSRADSQALTGSPEMSPGAYTMTETFYMSPRTKACVSLNNINCVTGNPF